MRNFSRVPPMNASGELTTVTFNGAGCKSAAPVVGFPEIKDVSVYQSTGLVEI